MRLPRLLLFSLLIALCVASAAAQSSPEKPAASPQLLPAPPQNVQPSTDLFQFQLEDLSLTPSRSGMERKDDARLNYAVTVGQNDNQPTCYTIRAYRVVRDTPGSDSTRPAGYSTCQRANRFQFKSAVYSPDANSRELNSPERAPR